MVAESTTLKRSEVESLVREVLLQRLRGGPASREGGARAGTIPGGPPHPLVVNVSARHMHVTPADLEVLFGPGAKLTKLKDLYQQGEFASEQLVTLVGPRQRIIPNVRILGPVRNYTQVELSYTDGVYLGLDLPLRISGNHEGTPGITILGPKGSITLSKGVIRAERHVHMGPKDAEHYGVKHLDRMNMRVQGTCPTVLEGLLVRVHKDWKLEVHIDTDEANCCDLPHATKVELFRP